jgi:hypothetical protein
VEKPQLVNFIAKIMEDSGFKVYKNFKTTKQIVDIYAVLPTSMGDFGVVVACKNYEKEFEVGTDILREMEEVSNILKASKITVVTSSSFSPQAIKYAERNNIKLVDRNKLITLAQKYSKKEGYNKNNPIFSTKPEESNFLDEKDKFYDNPLNYDNGEPLSNSVYDNETIEPNYTDSTLSYEDEAYVNEFLNNDNYGRETNSEPKYSLFKHNTTQSNSRSLFGARKNTQPKRKGFNFNIKRSNMELPASIEKLRPLWTNTIFLIVVVVLLSYIISYALISLTSIPGGIAGVVELLVALALSYGLVLFVDRDGAQILVKGTAIFFVSLIILMLLVIL